MVAPTHKSPWLGLSLLVGLLSIWLGWRQLEPVSANHKSLPTVATASFSDGVRLEIYQVSLGLETGFSRRTRPHWLPGLSNSLSRTYNGGGLEFNTRLQDGQFASLSLVNQLKTPMLGMVFRLIGEIHQPLSTDRFHSPGECLQITRSGSLFKDITSYGAVQPNEDRLDWTVEVEDGRGGWILMSGPIVANSEDGRAIAVCHAYPRDRQSLRIRFSRKSSAGPQRVEVQVPTPGFKPTFAALTPDALPSIKKAGDFEVTLSELSNFEGKLLLPKVVAKHPVATSDAIEVSTRFEDRFGNVIPHLNGMMPLPEEPVLRVLGEVNRVPSIFPYLEKEVEIIADVIWFADEKKRQIVLTDSAQAQGVRSLVIKPGSGLKEGRKQLPHLFEIELKGVMTEAEWRTWENDLNRHAICVFPKGSDRAQGESRYANSNWGTHSGKVDFTLCAAWCGHLKDGTPIRIGYPRKVPPATFTFHAALTPPK
jgi:hypothetical protein